MAIAAMILGIISAFFSTFTSWTIFGGIIGILCGIPAVILGALSMNSSKRTLALVGLILGIVGITFGIIFVAACTCAYGGCGSCSPAYSRYYW